MEVEVGGGLMHDWGHECNSEAWDLLKEVVFITSTIVWPQLKQQGGNTANRKLDETMRHAM